MADKTVLDFTEITDALLGTDVLYVIRGAGAGRDRYMKAEKITDLLRTRNYFINPDFRFWQRNTTANLTTSISYLAPDRWAFKVGTATGTPTIAQQLFAPGQTDVPDEPSYFLRATGGSLPTPLEGHHRVESVRTLEAKKVWLSFWAKKNVGAPGTIQINSINIIQNFGTGGSPSTPIQTQVVSGPIALNTTWTQHSFSFTVPSILGETIGTTTDGYLDFFFSFQIDNGGEIDMAHFQVHESPYGGVVPWEARTRGQELALCQRYYFKTFNQPVVPAQSAGLLGALVVNGVSGGTSFDLAFPVIMRICPILTYYNPSAANNNARNISDSTDTAISGHDVCDRGGRIYTVTDATDAGDTLLIHVTADAEL
jgi:hypothetical protein